MATWSISPDKRAAQKGCTRYGGVCVYIVVHAAGRERERERIRVAAFSIAMTSSRSFFRAQQAVFRDHRDPLYY